MPSFSYASPGGYTYHKIDPSAYKFSKHPAFSRPPTPPVFKPPVQPFFTEANDGGKATDEELKDPETQVADEKEHNEGEVEATEPETSGDLLQEEAGLYCAG